MYMNDADSLTSKLIRSFQQLDSKVSDKIYHASSEYAPLFEQIYISSWNQFYTDVLSPAKSFEANLGTIFADFRSLLLSAPVPTRRTPGKIFQQPFWRKRRNEATIRDMQYRRGFPPLSHQPQDWPDKLDSFWRFLTVDSSGVDFSSHEFTVSTMLGGKILYVTALGVQPAESISASRVPLYSFIFTENYSGWHLGRLVQQLNYLETSRLAAMYYFTSFRVAAYSLREISRMIAVARRVYVEDEESDAQVIDEKGEARWATRLDNLESSIRSINLSFSQIDSGFKSSFGYRLDRSRYYVNEFNAGLDFLDLGVVHGFQSYDAFVRRRLGPSFNSIESFYNQYLNVRSELSALTSFQDSERAQLVEIETKDRSQSLEELGDVADGALWGALLPYYTGSVLIHYMLNGENLGEKTNGVLWISIWDVFAALGLWLHIEKMKRKKSDSDIENQRRKIILYIFLINLVAIFLLYVWPEQKPIRVVVNPSEAAGNTLPIQNTPACCKDNPSNLHVNHANKSNTIL